MRNVRRSRGHGGAGVLEEFFRTTRTLAAGSLLDSAKDVVRDVLRRSMTVFLRTALAVVLLATGSVLLLAGGLEALRLMALPEAAAYAIMGLFALAGGSAAVFAAGSKERS